MTGSASALKNIKRTAATDDTLPAVRGCVKGVSERESAGEGEKKKRERERREEGKERERGKGKGGKEGRGGGYEALFLRCRQLL